MIHPKCAAVWRLLGMLSLVWLVLVGCGGNDGERAAPPPGARAISHVTLTVTFSDQAIEIRQASDTATPPQDAGETRGLVTRLEIRIEATEAGFVPITQTVPLTADEQETVTVNLEVPQGFQRQIRIAGFNADNMEIFREMATVDLLNDVQLLRLTLLRILIVKATTPLDLTERSFHFPDGKAFGIPDAVTLTFGTFEDSTAPLVLEAPGLRIQGTIIARTTCTLRLTSGTVQAGISRLVFDPCESDEIDGRLLVTNASSRAQSASVAPLAIASFILDRSQLDVLSQRLR